MNFDRLLPMSLCLACWVAGCAQQPTQRTGDSTSLSPPTLFDKLPKKPTGIDAENLPNFGFITRDVWRGGQPTDAGLRRLARAGMKTVIDLREEGPAETVPPGVQLVRMPISAWHADSVDPDALLEAIADSPKPVFIHCRQGRDRTGLAVAIYRLATGMSPKDACRELRNFHVNAWWQGALEQQIYRLQPTIVQKFAKPPGKKNAQG